MILECSNDFFRVVTLKFVDSLIIVLVSLRNKGYISLNTNKMIELSKIEYIPKEDVEPLINYLLSLPSENTKEKIKSKEQHYYAIQNLEKFFKLL